MDSIYLFIIIQVIERFDGNVLTHLGPDKMATIFQTTFSNENIWISIKVSLKFVPKGPNNNIPALVLGASQVTSHYLSQWWLVYWCIYASLGLNELMQYFNIIAHTMFDLYNLHST